MMGSVGFETLIRIASKVECQEMIDGVKYEVKIVGSTRDKIQYVQLKER
jgi:hypothetical protein